MPFLEDAALFKQIKAGQLAPVYLLYGAEGYFVGSAVRQIEGKAVSPGMESFNLQRFDGAKADWNEIEDACEALPMMAERKCVTVKDADAEKLAKADLDRLMEMIASPNASTVLILYTLSPVDIKKSSKWKKLAEAVARQGAVCEFAFQDKTTLRRALCERARKAHVSMDMETAGVLVERCSSSYSILQNELDKLIAYVQGKASGGTEAFPAGAPAPEITGKDVDDCCIRSIDSSAFDLAKSILSRNFDRAYHLLDELFYLRQEAIAILGALSMAFADLYRAKCAAASRISPDRMAADFKYPKNRMFAVKNAFRDVQAYSPEHIRTCIAALYEADRKLKSSRLDDRLILEQMLGEMQLAAVRH